MLEACKYKPMHNSKMGKLPNLKKKKKLKPQVSKIKSTQNKFERADERKRKYKTSKLKHLITHPRDRIKNTILDQNPIG